MEVEQLIRRIRNSDEKAFEELFFRYYNRLCGFTIKIVKSPELAKDCVQEVFLKIWRNRENWVVDHSLSVYLYQAVRNQALNKVEKRKTSRDYIQKYYEEGFHEGNEENKLSKRENKIVKEIWRIVEKMPPRRRMVFELHRKHGLSYKEISKVMDIALKTVENHMGKALQDIRDQLGYQKS